MPILVPRGKVSGKSMSSRRMARYAQPFELAVLLAGRPVTVMEG